jgi:hypothetical protein
VNLSLSTTKTIGEDDEKWLEINGDGNSETDGNKRNGSGWKQMETDGNK